MFNLIRADLYSIRKSKVIKILFCIVSVCSITMAVVSHLMAVGKVSLDSAGNASALGEPMMMSLIGAVLAGVFICGDFENKTIHDAISCGSGRRTIIVSKAISYFIVIAFMMIPYFVVTIIGVCMDFEYTLYMRSSFLGILSNVSSIEVASQMIFKILAITLTLMLVYASQMSICVALSFLIRKSILTVGICFGIPLLINLIMGLGNNVQILADFFSYTPFTMGYITLDAAASDFIKPIVVSIGFIIVLLAITYSGFRKSEVK